MSPLKPLKSTIMSKQKWEKTNKHRKEIQKQTCNASLRKLSFVSEKFCLGNLLSKRRNRESVIYNQVNTIKSQNQKIQVYCPKQICDTKQRGHIRFIEKKSLFPVRMIRLPRTERQGRINKRTLNGKTESQGMLQFNLEVACPKFQMQTELTEPKVVQSHPLYSSPRFSHPKFLKNLSFLTEYVADNYYI